MPSSRVRWLTEYESTPNTPTAAIVRAMAEKSAISSIEDRWGATDSSTTSSNVDIITTGRSGFSLLISVRAAEATTAGSPGVRMANLKLDQYGISSWSTYTTDGRRVSALNGPLKLLLDPVVLYRNLPSQDGPWFTIDSRGYRGGGRPAELG